MASPVDVLVDYAKGCADVLHQRGKTTDTMDDGTVATLSGPNNADVKLEFPNGGSSFCPQVNGRGSGGGGGGN